MALSPSASVETPSDEQLVARAQRGDATVLEQLYRRHVGFVWSRLTRLIGPEPEREDLVQQVFLELHHALPRFRGEARFATFLYRIVSNVCCDHLQRHRNRPRVVPLDALEETRDPRPSPEEWVGRVREIELSWRLLDRIAPKKRIAFLLRVVEGLSLEEISAVVGARPPAVWARVRAAERELSTLAQRHRTARGAL
jgi:RNA polymerase sigma-70 factor (ECF subfamily)